MYLCSKFLMYLGSGSGIKKQTKKKNITAVHGYIYAFSCYCLEIYGFKRSRLSGPETSAN